MRGAFQAVASFPLAFEDSKSAHLWPIQMASFSLDLYRAFRYIGYYMPDEAEDSAVIQSASRHRKALSRLANFASSQVVDFVAIEIDKELASKCYKFSGIADMWYGYLVSDVLSICALDIPTMRETGRCRQLESLDSSRVQFATSLEVRMEYSTTTSLARGHRQYRQLKCVWFDHRWSSDGCVTIINGNGTSTCECSHLTEFALLERVWEVENEAPPTQTAKPVNFVQLPKMFYWTMMFTYSLFLFMAFFCRMRGNDLFVNVKAQAAFNTMSFLVLAVLLLRLISLSLESLELPLFAIYVSLFGVTTHFWLYSMFSTLVLSPVIQIRSHIGAASRRATLSGSRFGILFTNGIIVSAVLAIIASSRFLTSNVDSQRMLLIIAATTMAIASIAVIFFFTLLVLVAFSLLNEHSSSMKDYADIAWLLLRISMVFGVTTVLQGVLYFLNAMYQTWYLQHYAIVQSVFLFCELVQVFCGIFYQFKSISSVLNPTSNLKKSVRHHIGVVSLGDFFNPYPQTLSSSIDVVVPNPQALKSTASTFGRDGPMRNVVTLDAIGKSMNTGFIGRHP